jgi:hypothetical protein
VDEKIVNAILAFRKGNVIIHPGGGGQYGWLELPEHLKNEKAEPAVKAGEEKKRASRMTKEKEKPGTQISFSDFEQKITGKALKADVEMAAGTEAKRSEENTEKTAGQKSLFDF